MAKTIEDYKTEAEALGLNTDALTTVAALKAAIKAKKDADKAGENAPEAKTAKTSTLDADLEAARKTVADLEAKKAKQAVAERAKAKAEAEKNDKRPKYKHANGLVYRFKKGTPETLNVDGAPKAIEDLIKNKEVMAELVLGNSNFLELVN